MYTVDEAPQCQVEGSVYSSFVEPVILGLFSPGLCGTSSSTHKFHIDRTQKARAYRHVRGVAATQYVLTSSRVEHRIRAKDILLITFSRFAAVAPALEPDKATTSQRFWPAPLAASSPAGHFQAAASDTAHPATPCMSSCMHHGLLPRTTTSIGMGMGHIVHLSALNTDEPLLLWGAATA